MEISDFSLNKYKPSYLFFFWFSRKQVHSLYFITGTANHSLYFITGTANIPILLGLILLTKLFCYTSKPRQKLKYLENEKSFSGAKKSIFHHLQMAFQLPKITSDLRVQLYYFKIIKTGISTVPKWAGIIFIFLTITNQANSLHVSSTNF